MFFISLFFGVSLTLDATGEIRHSCQWPTFAHYSKTHAMLIQGSSIKVRIFEEREAPARWLAVPVELVRFSFIGS
jgi:hypothetical protein